MTVFSKGVRYPAYAAMAAAGVVGYQYMMNKNTHRGASFFEVIKNRKDVDQAHTFYNFTDTIRSAAFVVRSPHVRNVMVLAAVCTWLTRRVLGPWLPITLRRRALVPSYAMVGWILYYRIFVIEKPLFRYAGTYWNTQIVERIRRRHFAPVPYMSNTHAQTAICNLLNGWDSHFYPRHLYKREAIPAFDGNDILLDWAVPPEGKRDFLQPDSPILLAVHGIMGNAQDNYMMNIMTQTMKRGYRGVVLYRWRIDNYEHRDLQKALAHIRDRYPSAPMFAIAFSAGGAGLMSYLTKVGKDTPLTAAIGVSVAWDFPDVMRFARHQRNKSYYFALNYAVQECVRRHIAHDKHLRKEQYEHVLKKWWDANDGHGLFDNFIDCLPYLSGKGKDVPPMPLHAKYGNPTDGHYANGAPGNLHKIAITTMLVHAMDDPIHTSYTSQCLEEAVGNKNIILITTKRGGHIGWHEGFFPTGPSWCDKLATSFISSVLAAHAQTHFTLDVVKRTLFSEDPGTVSAVQIRRAISSSNVSNLDAGTDLDDSLDNGDDEDDE